ncbi:hypothetical protein [Ralstonia pseudosolanacearum]|uniref:hypothetical protein n=1 Tax=Ralstonia pseudosolanacearum TaxID=1310165 RepID=UPI001FF8026E|nr:hypothetical protein [Ralstonia pseudosolanacearum]
MADVVPSQSSNAPALAAWQALISATNAFYASLHSTVILATQAAENNFNAAAIDVLRRAP